MKVWFIDVHGNGRPVHVIEKSAFDALAKDHDDDWKRIQDAERKCDELKSTYDELLERTTDSESSLALEKAESFIKITELKAQADKLASAMKEMSETATPRMPECLCMKERALQAYEEWSDYSKDNL